MKTQVETVKSEGFTLSRMIWRLLRRQPPGYVEQVLAINPGLADLGPLLPVGTTVKFPIDTIPPERKPAPVVRLWD